MRISPRPCVAFTLPWPRPRPPWRGCRRIEAAARRAREQASLLLLRELEAEEAASGPGGGAPGGAGGQGGAAAAGKGGAKAAAKAAARAGAKAASNAEKQLVRKKFFCFLGFLNP